MSRYADRPMDFADATLVHLAAGKSIETILTVDQTDFSVYRITGKRRFRVLSSRTPLTALVISSF
jgi:predicted nucleic acid-binding protein